MLATLKPAEAAAQAVLNAVRTDDGVLALPIDPVVIARGLGINVYHAPMPASVSGYLIKKLTSGPDIFLNENHSPVRQRFTCAHELGHYRKMFESDALPPDQYFFKRDNLASCGIDDDEIYANQFAAELLMPRDAVTDLMAQGLERFEVARRLHVSPDALGHRLTNLRLG
ncbi:ImmA/IrrE family metallo-endopeptidase [Mycobacteroides abscessus]|uniref:ImmA/IrrE family metallo-endopeptidase n=1 Tax=Mycobacteroides abscessus TaxID=36809 RepID=UPI0021071681|nr:ImmA/IrrE family metallo-endopeptidase [Mycobacteroides abscessus]